MGPESDLGDRRSSASWIGADRGGERRNEGKGSLPIEGKAERPDALPADELDNLGSVKDSTEVEWAACSLPGEGASLLGRTKNRAASVICGQPCSSIGVRCPTSEQRQGWGGCTECR